MVYAMASLSRKITLDNLQRHKSVSSTLNLLERLFGTFPGSRTVNVKA